MNTSNVSVAQAKEILKRNGYYIDNLWHINDVIGGNPDEEGLKINGRICDDSLAMMILDKSIRSPRITEEIFEAIKMTIEELENED